MDQPLEGSHFGIGQAALEIDGQPPVGFGQLRADCQGFSGRLGTTARNRRARLAAWRSRSTTARGLGRAAAPRERRASASSSRPSSSSTRPSPWWASAHARVARQGRPVVRAGFVKSRASGEQLAQVEMKPRIAGTHRPAGQEMSRASSKRPCSSRSRPEMVVGRRVARVLGDRAASGRPWLRRFVPEAGGLCPGRRAHLRDQARA